MPTEPTISVLIVDDEELYRSIMKEVLTPERGYTVTECGFVSEAISALQTQHFDVMVLDYKMPELSGLNLLQWMHEQKFDLPVLMLTGEGSEWVAVEAMKFGAYDYIRKEHLEMDRLPLIVNGIYERYLFRKERLQMESIRKEREKHLASLEAYQSATSSFTHIVNNALGIINLNLADFERELEPYVTPEGRTKFQFTFMELRHGYEIILSAMRSLEGVSTSLSNMFLKTAQLHQMAEQPGAEKKSAAKEEQ